MPTGWQGSNRRSRLPKDWPQRRDYVLKRDAYRCQHLREDTGLRCGDPARDVDHIVNDASGGTDDYSNLQALCPWHHVRKSGSEGGQASKRSRDRNRPKPRHPGWLP